MKNFKVIKFLVSFFILGLIISFSFGNDVSAERGKQWYLTNEGYVGLSYGGWKYAGASTVSGGSLHANHTSNVSNTYTGSLQASARNIQGLVGFNINYSWGESVGYTSKSYSKGRYRLEYRHVYKKYKVKQELKYDRRGRVVYATKYVYPMKWVERQYRVVKF